MVAKRIIPCLDVKNGHVVKGVRFQNVHYAGNCAALAKRYSMLGADEVVFLDISATEQRRKTQKKWVREAAWVLDIPFTVGGGVSSVEDVRSLLEAGADKVAINTAAVANPGIITECADEFGSQCIVIAIDTKKTGIGHEVFVQGGKKATGLEAVKWSKKAARLGAGEILLTSIDRDGTTWGFDIELNSMVAKACKIPLIASGGAGRKRDFLDVFERGGADAALAASVFHYGKIGIWELKDYLSRNGVEMRCRR
ncbi:MAG: imidazole glycerol phosphate synthase subunit HisF [Candidatus Micrarchaeia archaeon]